VGGRNFGALVHRVLEWLPLDAPERAGAMALALAPRFALDTQAARQAGELVVRVLALPIMQRAREASHAWRELPLCFPLEDELVEGKVDLVFEERGQLVVVDYKTDQIGAEQAIDQAAHHAPQLRLYGRGLTLATGLHVSERLVLFTSLGRVVPV
jgi:ATP-dependent exoDNAse (exonuclease V) beta subunit